MTKGINELFSLLITFAIIWVAVVIFFWFLSFAAAIVGFPGLGIIGFIALFLVGIAFLMKLYKWAKKYNIL